VGNSAISGKSLCFHKRGGDRSAKCNIVPGTGNIYIAVYEISRREKLLLDRIEGVGCGYFTETIDAPGFGDCFVYIASSSHVDNGLRPYTWYKDLVLAGCEAHRFPSDYIATIRSVAAIADPDRDRHHNNMQIVERARQTVNGATVSIKRQP
jgi:hypothetical protein